MLERDNLEMDRVIDWVVVGIGEGQAASWVGDLELASFGVWGNLEFDELEGVGWIAGCLTG